MRCPAGIYETNELADAGVLAIGDGYRAKNSELASSGLPFARAGNIDNGFHFANADRFPEEDLKKVGEKISRPGDVVFTSKGTVGRFAFVRDDTPRFVFSPQLCYWRSLDPDTIDPRWLYYWMNGREFWLQAAGVKGQTDMADYVSLTDQRKMTLTLPEIDEQRRTAAALGSLDDKIVQNRRTGAKLEELARAVFKAWFVDFEPVKAKAAGAKSFPGMPPATFAALPTTFQDSPLGPVPKGWSHGSLGELIDIHDSRRVPLSKKEREVKRGSYRYYGAAGVIDYVDAFLFDGIYVLTGEDGTVTNEDGTPVTQYVWGQFWVNNHAHVLTARAPSTNEYLLLLLQSLQVKPYITGAVQPKLSQGNMISIPVVVPDDTSLRAFGQIVAPLFAAVRCASDESSKLAELRDYLLPKLLSGEVRVERGAL